MEYQGFFFPLPVPSVTSAAHQTLLVWHSKQIPVCFINHTGDYYPNFFFSKFDEHNLPWRQLKFFSDISELLRMEAMVQLSLYSMSINGVTPLPIIW